MKTKFFSLTLTAWCAIPVTLLAQGTYLSAPDGNPTNALIVAPGGSIGIGITNPLAKLEVMGVVKGVNLDFGEGHTLGGKDASICGGLSNTVAADYSVVCGGFLNVVRPASCTVGGGGGNVVNRNPTNDDYAFSYHHSTIGGGEDNSIDSAYATISGGESNTASSGHSFIGGGFGNTTTGPGAAVVSGGYKNVAGGNSSTVPGGSQNQALGDFSFAAGRRALVTHQGSFVWADSEAMDFPSTADNQFLIRAHGGVSIVINNANAPHFQLDSSGNAAFSSKLDVVGELNVGGRVSCQVLEVSSDRNAKTNLSLLTLPQVLKKIASLEISEWEYTNAPGIRHCGAMAQDFHHSFGFGSDDKHINPLDAASVALAGVQALTKQLQQRDQQLKEKNTKITELESRVEKMEQQLTANSMLMDRLIAHLPAAANGTSIARTAARGSTVGQISH